MNGMVEVKNSIEALSAKTADFEPRSSTVEAKISAFEDSVERLPSHTPCSKSTNYEDVIAEFSDRNTRTRKLILFKVPESSNRDIHVKRILTSPKLKRF